MVSFLYVRNAPCFVYLHLVHVYSHDIAEILLKVALNIITPLTQYLSRLQEIYKMLPFNPPCLVIYATCLYKVPPLIPHVQLSMLLVYIRYPPLFPLCQDHLVLNLSWFRVRVTIQCMFSGFFIELSRKDEKNLFLAQKEDSFILTCHDQCICTCIVWQNT